MKKINWFKIACLILMIVELIIAFGIDKNLVKENITAWRLYIICIMFIPVNVIIIGTKRRIKR